MNTLERKMVDILKDLRDHHSVVGVKAEFEAEGTRMEEAMRLKEVLMKADLGLTLKIGGCEAIRDIYEARILGVSRIVAPMVESPYALKKFLEAIEKAVPKDEQDQIDFAINIETVNAYKNLDEMLSLPNVHLLDGIVIGRVDLCGSLGMDRAAINSDEVNAIVSEVLGKVKKKGLGLECAVGGAVSVQSLPFFRSLPKTYLDYYETRKVIFECPASLNNESEVSLLKAVEFELFWLKNKRDFYGAIYTEDENRIGMLEARYRKSMGILGISV
jgi:hypothetical protein